MDTLANLLESILSYNTEENQLTSLTLYNNHLSSGNTDFSSISAAMGNVNYLYYEGDAVYDASIDD